MFKAATTQRLILKSSQCPGDFIVMSAAVRDLHRTYPGRFETNVAVLEHDIFRENPYNKMFPRTPLTKEIPMTYNNRASPYAIHSSNDAKPRTHFLWGYIGDLNLRLNLKIKLTEFKPDLYLTEEEKTVSLIQKPYWVFASGGKTDFTTKWWDPVNWQTVADMLKSKQLVQVGGGSHVHPPINGVIDLVKKTSFRELMRLVYHSEGVMCIVTCLMHLAAAFNKPCVCVAGGREPHWWEAYTSENRLHNMRIGIPDWNPPANDGFIPHQYLHTLNQLDCCTDKGCWITDTIAKTPQRKSCKHVEQGPSITIPKCLNMITPEMVVKSVDWYYEQGILSKHVPHTVVLPPAPQIKIDRTLFFCVQSDSPSRIRSLNTLKAQVLNNTEVVIVQLGAEPRIQSTCEQNGWRSIVLPADADRIHILRSLDSQSTWTTLLLEEDLPKTGDWSRQKGANSALHWCHWPEGLRSKIEAAVWFVNPLTPRAHRLDPFFYTIPTEVLKSVEWLAWKPDEVEIVLYEYLRQKGIQIEARR